MYPKLVELAESNGLEHIENEWILPEQERVKRASDIINAIPYLAGGAKNTSHLTDVSPNLVILTSISTGNNIFMNIVREEDNEILFDLDAFEEVLSDYEDKLTSKIYIGMRKGFLPDIYEKLEDFSKENENIEFGTVKEISQSFSTKINELI